MHMQQHIIWTRAKLIVVSFGSGTIAARLTRHADPVFGADRIRGSRADHPLVKGGSNPLVEADGIRGYNGPKSLRDSRVEIAIPYDV